jgi:hypothetical protein
VDCLVGAGARLQTGKRVTKVVKSRKREATATQETGVFGGPTKLGAVPWAGGKGPLLLPRRQTSRDKVGRVQGGFRGRRRPCILCCAPVRAESQGDRRSPLRVDTGGSVRALAARRPLGAVHSPHRGRNFWEGGRRGLFAPERPWAARQVWGTKGGESGLGFGDGPDAGSNVHGRRGAAEAGIGVVNA